MEFTKVLSLRQSNRAFTDEPLTEAQIDALLAAANAAPTCMGRFERLHLTVVQDKRCWTSSTPCSRRRWAILPPAPTYGAPALIFVSNSLEDEEIIYGANASCVMENMLLAAVDQGLAGVYLFGISQALQGQERVAQLLQLPEGFRTVSAIAVGHPAQPLEPRPLTLDKIATNRV